MFIVANVIELLQAKNSENHIHIKIKEKQFHLVFILMKCEFVGNSSKRLEFFVRTENVHTNFLPFYWNQPTTTFSWKRLFAKNVHQHLFEKAENRAKNNNFYVRQKENGEKRVLGESNFKYSNSMTSLFQNVHSFHFFTMFFFLSFLFHIAHTCTCRCGNLG